MSRYLIHFECSIPILRVENLPQSEIYYVEVLGFQIDWKEPGSMTSVSRGRAAIMLCQGDQGREGTWVWFGVGDAAALHQEFVASGANVKLPPTNYPWACEFHVMDPDGHVLRFGSDPLHDQPFSPWVEWREIV